jgi:hypothetical protein
VWGVVRGLGRCKSEKKQPIKMPPHLVRAIDPAHYKDKQAILTTLSTMHAHPAHRHLHTHADLLVAVLRLPRRTTRLDLLPLLRCPPSPRTLFIDAAVPHNHHTGDASPASQPHRSATPDL